MKNNQKKLLKNALFQAQQAYVRVPIFVQGSEAFILSLMKELKTLRLISDDNITKDNIAWSQAKQWLGQELGSVIFDLRKQWDVEKLCALSGCVTGGNIVFFWLADDISCSTNYFEQRLLKLIQEKNGAFLHQDKENNVLLELSPSFAPTLPTNDQTLAIKGIEKVLYGHRRRPLFILADRGRGKSAALGLAAAKIMLEKKKHILVTSPRIANVATVFEHASQAAQLTFHSSKLSLENGSKLSFIAPDHLIAEQIQGDLLLVDEAAAIPLPMLNQIIANYSRVVFSSTEHGYEGTGRGFSHKFRALLNTQNQNWQEVKLKQPIRFAENCPLERWLYELFLFAAEPIVPDAGKLTISIITLAQLTKDEALLKQLFALLVTAHYQTSPNDLHQLLTDEQALLIGAFVNGILVAVVYAKKEGGFDNELSEKIAQGKRRVKGHLLAQSLAQHTGISDILTQPMFRIARLAVLPSWQKQGIATKLIKALEQEAKNQNITIIGSSFSSERQLVKFWLKQDYVAVRLGVQKDAASGNFSLQVVKSLSFKPKWQKNLTALFSQNFHYQISELYKDLPVELAAMLFTIELSSPPLSQATLLQVSHFAKGLLGCDHCDGSLSLWYCSFLAQKKPIDFSSPVEQLMFSRLVQRHSWQKLAKNFGLTGRKQLEAQMQNWFKAKVQD